MQLVSVPSVQLLLLVIHRKHSSQFCLTVLLVSGEVWLPLSDPSQPSQPSVNLPQSHGLFQDLQLSATWIFPCLSVSWVSFHLSAALVSLYLSAVQPFLYQCSQRIAGSQSTYSPWIKGKWLYQYVFPTSSVLLWVAAWLVPSWLSLLLPHPLQNKRVLPKQKAVVKQVYRLNRFICRGSDWCSLGQRQGQTGAREAYSEKYLTEAMLAAPFHPIKIMPNPKQLQLYTSIGASFQFVYN